MEEVDADGRKQSANRQALDQQSGSGKRQIACQRDVSGPIGRFGREDLTGIASTRRWIDDRGAKVLSGIEVFVVTGNTCTIPDTDFEDHVSFHELR